MVHILSQGKSICTLGERCQYPTRREAFANVLKLEKKYPHRTFEIHAGLCFVPFNTEGT